MSNKLEIGQLEGTPSEIDVLLECDAASGPARLPSSVAPRSRRTLLAQWLAAARFPGSLERNELLALAYRFMFLSRTLEQKLLELYSKGYVKGTVTSGAGAEAAATAAALAFRPGRDVLSLLHRDFAAHLIMGCSPYRIVCQYLANAESPTHGREGNVHHGDAGRRRFPMISHLGKMLSLVVGGTWAARRNGEDVFGLAIIGDGGTSTGEFHESLNLAAVHKVPVLFLVENNGYAFSTPTSAQFRCERLSDRARGYGIVGWTIDGTDPWPVYQAVRRAQDLMASSGMPVLLECRVLRLQGHAAYDKAEYVPQELLDVWWSQDPVARTRQAIVDEGLLSELDLEQWENLLGEYVQMTIARALKVARPEAPPDVHSQVFAVAAGAKLPRLRAPKVKNGAAVKMALDYLLSREPRACLLGLDVGPYGSAFKTCKGLVDTHGADRVIDMPLAESGIMGFAMGAAQTGMRPVVEFQFADFSTEAVTQLGLNAGTWFYRCGHPMPLLVRLPCGGGLTMGAFHSGEYEGLWSRFPGLKLLYPATAQETFEALVAGFYDPNPCLVFEHKLLYWSKSGDIDFDGDLQSVWRPRRYTEGSELTIVAIGAMVHESIAAAKRLDCELEVWNPFVLQPMVLDPIVESVVKTGRLLVVQESPEMSGVGDRIISVVVRRTGGSLKSPPVLLAAADSPVPFAPELEKAFRPDAERIVQTVQKMLGFNA